MKSLKRTLCLVLALVMVLGLFGIASATNFTDDNTIQYKEAVEVVTGIGAINGMGDGTFNPKGTITRAQAATMVTRVALTAGVAADLTGIESTFTDVTVDGGFKWAIPSIEYLVKEGAINGRGDGTFDPNGEISGYAVLKLLLCVLGYGAQDEYIGDQWTLQVAIDANNNGLTAGKPIAVSLSAPATREEVALYCYNALNADVVTFSVLNNRYETRVTAGGYGTTPTVLSLADKVYGLATAEGVITANGAINAACAKNGVTALDTTGDASADTYVKINTGLDLVGHYVKVYYKASTASNSNGAAATTPYAGFSVVDESTVIIPKATDIVDEASTDALQKWVNLFGADTKVAGTTGATQTTLFQLNNEYKDAITKITTTKGDGSSSNTKIEAGMYIVAKGEVKSALAAPAYTAHVVETYKAPTASATGEITFSDGGTAITIPQIGDTTSTNATNYAKINVYNGIAAGDVVTIAETGEFKTVAKADAVTAGTVTEYKTGTPDTFIANGTTYTKSTKATVAGATTARRDMTAVGAALVNKNCILYLAADGSVVAAAQVDDSGNKDMVYVVKGYAELASSSYGDTVYLNKLQCVDMEGNEKTYVVGAGTAANGSSNTVSGQTIGITTDSNPYAGKLVSLAPTYNPVIKADVYAATEVSQLPTNGTSTNVGSATNAAVEATAKKIADNNYYDANTKFFFVEGTGAAMKVTAFTGAQAIKASTNYTWYGESATADGNFTVKYVFVADAAPGSSTSGLLFAVAPFTSNKTASYTTAAGTPATASVNAVLIDGKPVEIKTTDDDYLTGSSEALEVQANTFYKYTVNEQGIYTLAAATAVDDGFNIHATDLSVTNVAGTLVSTTTANAHALDDAKADGAFVVDVNYTKKQLTNQLTPADVNHNTLASVKFGKVAYTFKTEGNETIVTGIYYLGAATDRAVAFGSAAAVENVTPTVSVATAPAGTRVTITLTYGSTALAADLTMKVTSADYKTAVGGATGADLLGQVTFATGTAQDTAAAVKTISFVVPNADVDDLVLAKVTA